MVLVQTVESTIKAQGTSYEFVIANGYFFDSYSDTQDVVTLKGTAYQSYLYLGYGGFNIEISSTGGNITRVEFETPDGTLAATASTGTFDPGTCAWTGSAKEITFSASKSGDQFISKVIVHIGSGEPAPKEIVYADAQVYNAKSNVRYEKVTYTRDFADTNWQALYVPFAINYDEWSTDYEIARIYSIMDYDDDSDGVFDRSCLIAQKLAPGSATTPNTPYLIRANQIGSHSIELLDRILQRAESRSVNCRSVDYVYTFNGTYSAVSNMMTNGYYTLTNGELSKVSSDAETLEPQRWYMAISDRNDIASARPQNVGILLMGDMNTVNVEQLPSGNRLPSTSFDLQGRAINTLSKMPRGIQIVNGQKVIR